ncbi:MAG: hypothetical protein IPI85_04950 [Dehalococcoidia bacterium]|nr:hypothetical protein [Dehalococcoidia bacterium]
MLFELTKWAVPPFCFAAVVGEAPALGEAAVVPLGGEVGSASSSSSSPQPTQAECAEADACRGSAPEHAPARQSAAGGFSFPVIVDLRHVTFPLGFTDMIAAIDPTVIPRSIRTPLLDGSQCLGNFWPDVQVLRATPGIAR